MSPNWAICSDFIIFREEGDEEIRNYLSSCGIVVVFTQVQ